MPTCATIDRAASGRPTIAQSRRGFLRLVSAGTLAIVAGSQLGSQARSQSMFPGLMRVLHASPDLGKVEVLFNDNKMLDEFDYGQSSNWIELDPGLIRVTILRDRLFINDVVYDTVYAVVADEHVNLIISDPLLIPAPVDRAPLPPDMARMRFLHASIDTPPIDIVIEGGSVVVALAYGQQSVPLEIAVGTYHIEVRATQAVLAEGTLYFADIRDLTERQEAEAALRASEERYHTMMTAIDEGFAVCQIIRNERGDPVDYRHLAVNPAWERLTGNTAEQGLTKTARELIPQLEDRWIERYGRVALQREPIRIEALVAPLDTWFSIFATRSAIRTRVCSRWSSLTSASANAPNRASKSPKNECDSRCRLVRAGRGTLI